MGKMLLHIRVSTLCFFNRAFSGKRDVLKGFGEGIVSEIAFEPIDGEKVVRQGLPVSEYCLVAFGSGITSCIGGDVSSQLKFDLIHMVDKVIHVRLRFNGFERGQGPLCLVGGTIGVNFGKAYSLTEHLIVKPFRNINTVCRKAGWDVIRKYPPVQEGKV